MISANSAAGKTTLITNFIQQKVTNQQHNPTIGIELHHSIYVYEKKQILFKIYEIQSCKNQWKHLTKSDFIFLIFDSFDTQSFLELRETYNELKKTAA